MFKIFESKEEKYVKSHLRHLTRLAMSDGVLHHDEVAFIKKIGKKNGLSDSAVKAIIKNPTSVDIEIPKSNKERFNQIFDLTQMMMKDGQVNDAEMEFCMDIANRLGFRKVIVGVLVAKITRGIEGGLSRKKIMDEAEPFINY